MIPFLDLKTLNLSLEEGFHQALARVLSSGRFILGEEVEAFEVEFSAYCQTSFCVGVSNGLDALHLILRAYEIGPGDEVIVPANTFIATWLAVSYSGARPVPVDCRSDTGNIDVEQVVNAITPHTRAIIAVHLFGQAADIEPLKAVAQEYGLYLIEDAAQAHGATYHGHRIGSLGDAAGFSFYPGKNLGALGDGGAITTSDPDLVNRLQLLRNYGSRQKYKHEEMGFNSRLDELQAAFLRVKLSKLDVWNLRRREIALRYLRELADCDIILPKELPGNQSSWHLFVIRSPRRSELLSELAANGVETSVHYPVPPHQQSAYAKLNIPLGSFPNTEAWHREALSLPIGPTMSDEEVGKVIDALQLLSPRNRTLNTGR
jgi:dTDP-4-amino-4,6-dideoxygalactose transaminase